MNQFIEAICLVLIALTGLLYLYNLSTRRWDAFSWRNLFLLGFLHFYLLGTIFTAGSTYWSDRYMASSHAWMLLAILIPVTFFLFLASASIGAKLRSLTKLIPPANFPISATGVLTIIVVCVLGAGAALVIQSGYLALIAYQLKGGLATTAVGLATYYLLARKFNPFSWLVFFSTLAAAGFVAMVGGSGRRALLGVFIAVPWIWYFTDLRYRSVAGTIVKIGAVGFAAVVALAIYTGFRQEGRMAGTGVSAGLRAQQVVEAVKSPQIERSQFELMLYTDTATNTLYILDTYPSGFDYQPFQGLMFILANPIPRSIWPDKPEALGVTLMDAMGTSANLGPGIIGHGWSEGGAIGVVLYAIFFGLLMGVVDQSLRDRAWNPYYLAVMGAGLGNVIALPRGDTPLFLLQIVASIVASFGVVYAVGIPFRALFAAGPPLPIPDAPPPGTEEYDDEYDWYDEQEPDPDDADLAHDRADSAA